MGWMIISDQSMLGVLLQGILQFGFVSSNLGSALWDRSELYGALPQTLSEKKHSELPLFECSDVPLHLVSLAVYWLSAGSVSSSKYKACRYSKPMMLQT